MKKIKKLLMLFVSSILNTNSYSIININQSIQKVKDLTELSKEDLVSLIKQLKSTNIKLQEENSDLKLDLDSYKETKSTLFNENKELESKHKTLKEEINGLNETLNSKNIINIHNESKIKILSEENENLKTRLEKKDKAYDKLIEKKIKKLFLI